MDLSFSEQRKLCRIENYSHYPMQLFHVYVMSPNLFLSQNNEKKSLKPHICHNKYVLKMNKDSTHHVNLMITDVNFIYSLKKKKLTYSHMHMHISTYQVQTHPKQCQENFLTLRLVFWEACRPLILPVKIRNIN